MTLDELKSLESNAKAAEYHAKNLKREANGIKGYDLVHFIQRLNHHDATSHTRKAADRILTKFGPELITLIELDMLGQAREHEAQARLAWAEIGAFLGPTPEKTPA